MKKLISLFSAFLVMCMPALAFAQDATEATVAANPPVPPEGFDLVPAIISAAQGGHWGLFASLVIMALVWLATKAPLISDFITREAKVWVSAIAGTLLVVATAIFTTSPDSVSEWLSVILTGLSTGFAATGMWELFKRLIAKKPIDADGDGVMDK